jgi:hypothetical protein
MNHIATYEARGEVLTGLLYVKPMPTTCTAI